MQETPIYHRSAFWPIVFAIVVILILIVQHLGGKSDQNEAGQPIPVVTAVAHSGDVPVYISALGSVTATYTVTVRTQINGQLVQVFYREGQMVKKGDLLAQIDPRLYEAQLLQYQGQLARDMALLTNAQLDLKRYQELWKENSVAKQQLDTQASLVKQSEGTVQLDRGLITSTQLNLTYCRIVSPIDGRVGLRLVDPGNFVQTSDTNGLAVITTLSPITVIFSIPEDNLPAVMDQLNAGKTLVVQAYDRSANKLLATGTLLTVDNQIDPTTGTVKLKSSFLNQDNHLFANQFVNVQLLVTTLHNATIVPTTAIQNGAQGPFVYLLNNNHTVSVKPVKVGVTVGENTNVTAGVVPGQSVVVEGVDKLTDGAKVTVTNAPKSTTHKPQVRRSILRFLHI